MELSYVEIVYQIHSGCGEISRPTRLADRQIISLWCRSPD